MCIYNIYTCIYRDTLPISQVDVAWDLGCSAPKNLRLGKVGIGVSTARLRKSSASVPWCLLRSGKACFWCFLPAKITNSCFEKKIDDVQFRFGWCQTEKTGVPGNSAGALFANCEVSEFTWPELGDLSEWKRDLQGVGIKRSRSLNHLASLSSSKHAQGSLGVMIWPCQREKTWGARLLRIFPWFSKLQPTVSSNFSGIGRVFFPRLSQWFCGGYL